VNHDHIRLVTAQMHRQIATGTFDAPSWGLIRAAKMATPIYAPLGTAMSLGDYVRVTRAFLEVFKAGHLLDPSTSSMCSSDSEVSAQLQDEKVVKLKEDLQVSRYLTITFPPFQQSLARRTSQNYTCCESETIASAVGSHVQ
jgi:glycerol-3-phosphate O-acyltransferase / dihydroxyacetone phosphate acyltransferase